MQRVSNVVNLVSLKMEKNNFKQTLTTLACTGKQADAIFIIPLYYKTAKQ